VFGYITMKNQKIFGSKDELSEKLIKFGRGWEATDNKTIKCSLCHQNNQKQYRIQVKTHNLTSKIREHINTQKHQKKCAKKHRKKLRNIS